MGHKRAAVCKHIIPPKRTMISQVFHSVPHVNITFHPVDPRFNPKNELYLESLGIIASVPAAWLITTLVVLLIYLCTRCCDTKVSSSIVRKCS